MHELKEGTLMKAGMEYANAHATALKNNPKAWRLHGEHFGGYKK